VRLLYSDFKRTEPSLTSLRSLHHALLGDHTLSPVANN